MSDLIDRQAAIDVLAEMQGRCTSKTALIQNSKIWQQIKDLPSAEPVQYGEWILWDGKYDSGYICSRCKRPTGLAEAAERYKYCPFCGSKMRKANHFGNVTKMV